MLRWYIIMLLVLPGMAQGQSEPPVDIRMSIYFGGGSYDIDEFQVTELYHWLDSVPNLEKYQIHLISHTDPIGGKQFNEWLSKMRSESVQHLLLNKQIPEHKITIKNWGLENPVYSNQT